MTRQKSKIGVIAAASLLLITGGYAAVAWADIGDQFELGDDLGQAGSADIVGDPVQPGPDWDDLFDADGHKKDEINKEGLAISNHIADAIDYGGYDAAFFSGTDLGNAYLYADRDGNGELILYAGAERAPTDSGHVEFELLQDPAGDARSVNDLLIGLDLGVGGTGVEVWKWDQDTATGSFQWVETLVGEGCVTGGGLCAVRNAALIEGGSWSEAAGVDLADFAELGLNLDGILGFQKACYRGVVVRNDLASAAGGFYNCKGTAPSIWSDRSGYHLEDTVRVLGWNLVPGTDYDILVVRPDGSIVHGDGSCPAAPEPCWDTVTTNGDGDLLELPYQYLLNGGAGVYEVQVHPSPWDPVANAEPLARTSLSVMGL